MRKLVYILFISTAVIILQPLHAEYREFLNKNKLYVYVRADLITEMDGMSIEEQDIYISGKVKKRALLLLKAHFEQQKSVQNGELSYQQVSSLITGITEIDSIEKDEFVEAYYLVTLQNLEELNNLHNETTHP